MHNPAINREAPLCLAPLTQFTAPAFAVPRGAVDTHAHVVSANPVDYPMVAERSYTPPPAPEEKYLKMLNDLGMRYGVLVQISVYGTDNRYMLSVLRKNPDRLRGIAVVSPSVTDRELEDMHAAGVRGLRINVLFGGGIGFDAMELLAKRIAPLGWHMQFLMDVRTLPDLMPRMINLPVPGIIDHMGHAPVAMGLNTPGFAALHHLVSNHGFWVKLSGAYRISNDHSGYADVCPLAKSLIDAAPERMVWGSDWPHVSLTQMPDTGALLNLLGKWVPDENLRHQILVENPARLYGFPAADEI